MRHRAKKNKFGHGVDNTHMTLRKLCNNFLAHDRMETTMHRARATKSQLERLIEKAKVENEANKIVLRSFFDDEDTVAMMFSKIGPFWKDVQGGYVRVVRLTERESDASAMGRLEWSKPFITEKPEEKKVEKKIEKEEIKK